MRTTRIQPEALKHLLEWAVYEPKLLKRIFRMMEECAVPRSTESVNQNR